MKMKSILSWSLTVAIVFSAVVGFGVQYSASNDPFEPDYATVVASNDPFEPDAPIRG